MKKQTVFWLRKGLEYIFENPREWLILESKKLFLIFNTYEIPNDENYPFNRKASWLLSLPLFSYGVILPLGITGMFLQPKENRSRASLLIIFTVLYTGVLLLTFVTSAYRLPLHIPFILFAGLSFSCLKDYFLRRNFEKLAFVFIVFLALAWVTHIGTFLSEKGYELRMKQRLKFLEQSKGRETERLYPILTR